VIKEKIEDNKYAMTDFLKVEDGMLKVPHEKAPIPQG
jgi:hypothetical protein